MSFPVLFGINLRALVNFKQKIALSLWVCEIFWSLKNFMCIFIPHSYWNLVIVAAQSTLIYRKSTTV